MGWRLGVWLGAHDVVSQEIVWTRSYAGDHVFFRLATAVRPIVCANIARRRFGRVCAARLAGAILTGLYWMSDDDRAAVVATMLALDDTLDDNQRFSVNAALDVFLNTFKAALAQTRARRGHT